MGASLSATTIQKTFKEGVLTIFCRATSTGAAGTQTLVTAKGASKGVASLTAEATTGVYTLVLDPSIKAQVVLGAPVISYVLNDTLSTTTVRVARTSVETVATSAPTAIQFVAQDAAGNPAYYPVGGIITITLTISTSPVF